MEGSGGGGGVVSEMPGDERDEPEVPPGVVGVVGVALRMLQREKLYRLVCTEQQKLVPKSR